VVSDFQVDGRVYRVFFSPTVHKTTSKFRLDLIPAPFWASHFLSIICIVEFVCFRVICCWSHCVFFTILLSSTIQTLVRRHHLPFDHATNRVNFTSLFSSPSVTLKKNRNENKDRHLPFHHATNRVNAASLFFSFDYVKKNRNKKRSTSSVWSRHKPSQRRFLVFLLRSRKKKQKQKKENEGERIQSGCLISVVLNIPSLNRA
jgi:hypothetical protein